MAVGKEYELLFLLTAKIDSAFGTGFSTAQSALKDMQTEINGYNQTLRDIASYKQNISAITQMKNSLKEQKEKLKEVSSALQEARQREQEAGTSTAELTAKKKQQEQAIDGLNVAIKEERAAIAQIDAELKQEGSDTADLTAKKKQHKQQLAELVAKKKEEEAALAATKVQLKENGTETADLEKKEAALKQQIQELDNKIKAKEQSLSQMGTALKEAGVNTKNLTASEEDLKEKTQEVKEQMETWQGAVNNVTDLANTFSALRMATDDVLEGVTKLTDGIKSCVSTAAGLEYTMSAVSAISGATEDELNQLTATAKETGATTVFTAQESAEAMQTMALAGWDVEEMLSGLPAVTKLAAASGEDLTDMTSIVSDALNAFGLEGEEAVTKFADVLTQAATSSNTTVSLMGQSLSYVETTAGNLGYTIEDVSLALAAMANNALKGSVSGSSLNTMLTRMSGANATATAEMEELGLSMYDSTGEAKPLLQFINELREAFSGFGDNAQEAQVAAYKLAGQRGMRGLLALVNSSDEEWEKLVEDVYDFSGAADSISTTRLENYTGKVTLLTSATEALETSIGEALIPAATDGASALTVLVNVADVLAQAFPGVTTQVTVGAYEMKGLLSVVSELAPTLMSLKYMMQTLDAKTIALVGSVGKWAAVGVAASMAVAGLYTSVKNLVSASDEAKSVKTSTDELIESLEEENKQTEESLAVYGEKRTQAAGLAQQLEALMTTTAEHAGYEETTKNIVAELNDLLPGLGLEYDELSGKVSRTTEQILAFNSAMSYEEVSDRKAYIQSLKEQETTLDDAIAAAQAQYDEEVAGWEKTVETQAQNRSWSSFGGYALGNANSEHKYKQAILEAEQAKEEAEEEIAKQEAILQAYAQRRKSELGVEGISDDSYLAVEDAAYTLVGVYGEVYEAALESFSGQMGLLDDVGEHIATMGKAYQEAYDSALDTYTGLFNIWDEAEKAESTSMATIRKNLDSQESYFAGYYSNLSLIASANVLPTEVFSQLTDGSEDAVAAAEAIVTALQNGDTSALADIASQYQNIYDYQVKIAELEAENQRLTADDIISNMESRVNAQKAYLENLQTILNSGIELPSDLWSELSDNTEDAWEKAQAFAESLSSGDTSKLEEAVALYQEFANIEADSAELVAMEDPDFQAAVDEFVSTMQGLSEYADQKEALMTIAQDSMQGFIDELGIKGGEAETVMTEISQAEINAVKEVFGSDGESSAMTEISSGAGDGFIQGIAEKESEITSQMGSTATAAADAFSENMSYSKFYQYGQWAMQGAISGLLSKKALLVSTAASVGTAMANAYKSTQDINSPSKLFYWFSEMDAGGAIQGLEDNRAAMEAAFSQAARDNAAAYLSGGDDMSLATDTPYLAQSMTEATATTPLEARSYTETETAGAVVQISYAPVINADSGTDTAEIRRQLEEHDEELLDLLDEYMDNRERTQRRRRY
jgi:TP901 family phage tail tape measure protein